MFLDGVGAVYHLLEVGGLPDPGVGMGGCGSHFGSMSDDLG